MKKLCLATATLLTATMLTAGHANACGFFDFSCNAAKQKAEKTQMVISIIDAGRKAGWKDVWREFSNREIAEAGPQAAAAGDYAAAAAADAAEYATQVAAEQVQAAAEKAAVEAHHAAIEATYAAERAAHKAEFIATAMAEGVSREDAERLATEAGH